MKKLVMMLILISCTGVRAADSGSSQSSYVAVPERRHAQTHGAREQDGNTSQPRRRFCTRDNFETKCGAALGAMGIAAFIIIYLWPSS